MTRTERKQFNQIKYKLTKTKKTDHCESMTVEAEENNKLNHVGPERDKRLRLRSPDR